MAHVLSPGMPDLPGEGLDVGRRQCRWGNFAFQLVPGFKRRYQKRLAYLSGTTLFLPTLWVFAGWRPCCLISAN